MTFKLPKELTSWKKMLAVIGAGVLGVNTAYFLAKKNQKCNSFWYTINMLEWKQVILMAHK